MKRPWIANECAKETGKLKEYQHYSKGIDRFELTQGGVLLRAENKEFLKSWVVYRGINEDFSQSYAETRLELEGVKSCFWIELNGRRLGGAIMMPNGIGDCFLIPPESDPALLLSMVLPLLEAWSEKDKEIRAQAIAPTFLGAFQQAGFVLQESRFWMIRPTELLRIKWSPKWLVTSLDPEMATALASLLKEAFAGGDGGYGARDYNAHLASVKQFFEGYVEDSDCGRGSASVFEKETGKLAAVCMVDVHKGLPAIRFLAVTPGCQRRGLANNLLRRAVSALSPNHDWVKLAVTDGNPAVLLYQNLGFISGDRLYQLSKPASP